MDNNYYLTVCSNKTFIVDPHDIKSNPMKYAAKSGNSK